MKKIILFLAGASLAILPLTSFVQATNGQWESITSTAAWNQEAYKLEKLSFAANTVGPLSFGDHAVVGEPTKGCVPVQSCDQYDAYVLKDGMRMFVGTVPSAALDEQRYALNGNVFTYVTPADADHTRWDATLTDLSTGERKTEMEDLFMDGVEEVDMLRNAGKLYLNPSFNWNNHQGYSQATIYSFSLKTGEQRTVSDHYELGREELQDARDGRVLSRMVFASGNKELWVYDTTKDPVEGKAIPGTWTPSNEQITGAHFRSDGSVEYFYLYQRYVYDGASAPKAQGDTLSWYRPASEAIQIRNGRMAWLDPNDVLRVSGAKEGTLNFGTLGYPVLFRLTDDAISFASGTGGKRYDFAKHTTTEYPFVVTDTNGDVSVGVDAAGTVWYQSEATGKKLSLGRGAAPVLSDENHLYWRTADGVIFEATILPGAGTGLPEARALQVPGSATVYLALDNTVYPMHTEKIYFSWFKSWNFVQRISAGELATYENGGEASFAPGTRVRLAGDVKVYLVDDNGSLRWLTTPGIAASLLGETWNQNVIDITQADLPFLTFGSQILTEQDVK
ncbi:MAG TPA: hypothetical protein VJB99_04675 [Patescibacteria group bacterium]|nr:hypothetical protein [Patescibacteria group bacterium]